MSKPRRTKAAVEAETARRRAIIEHYDHDQARLNNIKQVTVGQLTEFLSDFDPDMQIAFYLKAADLLPVVELFTEDNTEGFPPYPMIVVSWGNEE